MALTEEEKKKKMQQDISLDEWYNTNQQNIERQAQQQYEDAYVNRELMNKYLNQNLASQGLADTGIANLYAQQANTDYMNQRANIANAQQEAETNLFNQYYTAKKEEKDQQQKDVYNMVLNKVNNSLNEYGKLSDDTIIELEDYIDNSGLKDYYLNLAKNYVKGYTPTKEQNDIIKEQEEIKDLSPYYDIEDARVRKEIDSLVEPTTQKLSKSNAAKALEILENNRKLIGEDNYAILKREIKDAIMDSENIEALEEREKEIAEEARKYNEENAWYDPNDSALEKYFKYDMNKHEQNKNAIQKLWKDSGAEDWWNTIVRLFSNK